MNIVLLSILIYFILTNNANAFPAVAAAVVSAVAANAAAIGFALLKIGISFILARAAASVRARESRRAAAALAKASANKVLEIVETIHPRSFLYGEARIAIYRVHVESTQNNEFLHIIGVLASHEVESIGAIWFDDFAIYPNQLDGSGNVIAGKYINTIRIKKHLGADDQVADTDLVAELPGWTANHRLRGIAYVYVRLAFTDNKFPASIPNISAWVQGKKVTEIRDSAAPSVFSTNPVLCIRDYLLTSANDMGLGFLASEIDDANFIAGANICDQEVTVEDLAVNVVNVNATDNYVDFGNPVDFNPYITGDKVDITSTGSVPLGLGLGMYVISHKQSKEAVSGQFAAIKLATTYDDAIAGISVDITTVGSGTITVTKKAEPRYTCNGPLDSDQPPFENLEVLLSCMGGSLIHVGATWGIFPAVFRTPTIDIDENDLINSIEVITKHSRRSRFNSVKGIYISPINNGVPTDYPPVKNTTYETEDNGVKIPKDIDFLMVNRPHTSMRLAKLELERHRQQILVRTSVGLVGLQFKPTDVLRLSNTRFGWTNKEFEVVNWDLRSERQGNGGSFVIGVDLVLRETASAVFDWNSGEETEVDPAPNTNLPDVFTVIPPTGLGATSGTASLFVKADGTVVSRIIFTWVDSVDAFVERYEIQFKKSADSAGLYEFGGLITIGLEEISLFEVEDGTAYDIRIRAINHLSVNSAFVELLNHTVVGKTAPPDDVTGFSAAQSGSLVTFRWNQVTNADLAGYELRFEPRTVTPDWDSSTLVTAITRGTLITNTVLPPGDWTIHIRAVDTSGNESVNSDLFNILVSTTLDIITELEEAPDWVNSSMDTSNNFVKHWTGVLIPKSQDLVSTGGFTEFDKFVHNPVTSAIYEADEVDVLVDGELRAWASWATAFGPLQSGVVDILYEIDYRKAAESYDGFETWGIGTVNARFIKHRFTLQNLIEGAVPYITSFEHTSDNEERTERDQNVTIGIGGTSIVYSSPFHVVPNLQITINGALLRFYEITASSTTGFTIKIKDASDVDTGGNIDWLATGI